jgi:hypothetical protein
MTGLRVVSWADKGGAAANINIKVIRTIILFCSI